MTLSLHTTVSPETSSTRRLQVLRVLRHRQLLQGANELGPQGWGDNHKAHSRAGTCSVPPVLAPALLILWKMQVQVVCFCICCHTLVNWRAYNTPCSLRQGHVGLHLFRRASTTHTFTRRKAIRTYMFERQKAMPVSLCACKGDAASPACRMRHGMRISRRTRCRGIRRSLQPRSSSRRHASADDTVALITRLWITRLCCGAVGEQVQAQEKRPVCLL